MSFCSDPAALITGRPYRVVGAIRLRGANLGAAE
jgi:hypothetical protein